MGSRSVRYFFVDKKILPGQTQMRDFNFGFWKPKIHKVLFIMDGEIKKVELIQLKSEYNVSGDVIIGQ